MDAPEASPILDQPRATSTQHSAALTQSHNTRLMCCVLGLRASYELATPSYPQQPPTGGDRQFLKMARE